MRILLSSVGRRGYLVRFFQEAVGPGDEIWGGDCSPYASAFRDCDKSVLLPEVTAPSYVDDIIDLCRRCGIDMIVPLIDPELEVLARQRTRFHEAGIMAVVSPLRTVEIGFDKYLTYRFGEENGIPVPVTVLTVREARKLLDEGRLKWPVLVKPRKGSASKEITTCRSLAQLRAAFEATEMPMIQELVEGDEYGYDILCDDEYRPISIYCKRKLLMRAGETDKAVSVDDPELVGLGVKLAEALEIFGPLDADVMVGSSGPKLLELNPRFGGGYPCSHLCGADFPRKLIAMFHGHRLTPDIGSSPAGVYMYKQDEIIRSDQERVDSIGDYSSVRVTKPLRILFTSAGRRVSLLREFRRAAGDLGMDLRIHAADRQPLAPALQVADETVIVPAVASEDYCDSLLRHCREREIDAVVPLIDPELLPLSCGRERFAEVGTRVIISSPDVIRISIDKVLTNQFLNRHGFRTPRILTEEELASPAFPLFIKPRDGSSSLGAHRISTAEDLAYFRHLYPGSIIQEFIEGVEYTVDVFADFEGRPRCAVPRRRREVRAGEVSKAQAVRHARMIEENCRLVEALSGCQGMMTIQCFLTAEDEIVFIEINPRFGGGVPLSIQAGADSPRWILELLGGRAPTIAMDGWSDGLLMLRYDHGIFVLPESLPK